MKETKGAIVHQQQTHHAFIIDTHMPQILICMLKVKQVSESILKTG